MVGNEARSVAHAYDGEARKRVQQREHPGFVVQVLQINPRRKKNQNTKAKSTCV